MTSDHSLMTLVLDTQPWSIEYAQYDSLFRFYEHGLNEVIYRAYMTRAKSRNATPYLHSHEQLEFANAIELDFHDALAYELEWHNHQARQYMTDQAMKEALLIDDVAARILGRVHHTWRHLFPTTRAVFHPNTTQWHGDAFSVVASLEPIRSDERDQLHA
jgi:hypothetical protein